MFEQALDIEEMMHGPEHPDVATGLSNLAGLLQDVGEAAKARLLLERALAIDEKVHGLEHLKVGIRLSNLGPVLRHLGELAQARQMVERALAIKQTTCGPEHPDVATDLSNLALVLRDLGEAAQALPLAERALAVSERADGPEHPTVAIRLSNLALVLKDLGEAAKALPLAERALRIMGENAASRASLRGAGPRQSCSGAEGFAQSLTAAAGRVDHDDIRVHACSMTPCDPLAGLPDPHLRHRCRRVRLRRHLAQGYVRRGRLGRGLRRRGPHPILNGQTPSRRDALSVLATWPRATSGRSATATHPLGRPERLATSPAVARTRRAPRARPFTSVEWRPAAVGEGAEAAPARRAGGPCADVAGAAGRAGEASHSSLRPAEGGPHAVPQRRY